MEPTGLDAELEDALARITGGASGLEHHHETPPRLGDYLRPLSRDDPELLAFLRWHGWSISE